MKIVNKIILSAVAAAALVFATACSNDYTVAEYEAGAKKVLNQAEINEKILAALGGSTSKLELPVELDPSKCAGIIEKTTVDETVPTSTDAATTKAIKDFKVILGNSMRIDGTTIRFNCGGSLQKNGKNAVVFTIPAGSDCTRVKVNFESTNADRHLALGEFNADNADNVTLSTAATEADSTSGTAVAVPKEHTFTVVPGKKYMLGGKENGLWITKITFEEAVM